MEAQSRKQRWSNAFLYALVTTVMTLSTAILLSALLSGAQKDLADRVDKNTLATQHIICAALAEAETAAIREVIAEECPVESPSP